MRFSELRGRSPQSGQQGSYSNDDQTSFGQIRNPTAYPTPIRALYQGQPVTLIAQADIVGMSPAEKFVDQDGRIDWASSEDFKVVDLNVVPHSAQQLQNLQNLTRGRQ